MTFIFFFLLYGSVLESISAGIMNVNAHMTQAGYGITGRGGDYGITTKCLRKTHICESDSAYGVVNQDLYPRMPRNTLFFTCV